jgi:hypothetical protein
LRTVENWKVDTWLNVVVDGPVAYHFTIYLFHPDIPSQSREKSPDPLVVVFVAVVQEA